MYWYQGDTIGFEDKSKLIKLHYVVILRCGNLNFQTAELYFGETNFIKAHLIAKKMPHNYSSYCLRSIHHTLFHV